MPWTNDDIQSLLASTRDCAHHANNRLTQYTYVFDVDSRGFPTIFWDDTTASAYNIPVQSIHDNQGDLLAGLSAGCLGNEGNVRASDD